MKWLNDFKKDIHTKRGIIISGNINDIYYDKNSDDYLSILGTIEINLKNIGYKTLSWSQIDGIKGDNDYINSLDKVEEIDEGDEYNFDDEDTNCNLPKNGYSDPEEFFPLIYPEISKNEKRAFIIDLTHYLFSANNMADNQKKWASYLSKAIRESKDGENQNIIIFILDGNGGGINQIFHKNPLVSNISIPLPDRKTREKYIIEYIDNFQFNKELDEREIQDFIDNLDGFLIRDIIQLQKLSLTQTDFTPKKLINFYKYGVITSPWEEFSKSKLKTINEILQKRVKGQDKAILKVEKVVKRAFTGLSGLVHSTKSQKPKGVLFFVGPTGVGKTELAKSLAEFIFGDEESYLRFDMSEYNHEHSDQRLVGAPPGYVGYEKGGQLTNAIKEKPFSVVLFDEIEKAHGKILDKFLQILEDGRLTDGKGETISFSDTIIIFTSNIGASKENGVDKVSMNEKELENYFKEKVENHFQTELKRPELLGRIGSDNIVVFNYIQDEEIMKKIIKSKLKPIFDVIKEKYKVSIEFEDEEKALKAIANNSNKELGGRGILNTLEEKMIDPLSETIFDYEEELGVGKKIIISQFKDKARFSFEVE